MTALIATIISICLRPILPYYKKTIIRPSSTTQSKYKLPLPKQKHLILNEDVIKGRRLIFIGDVHGCLDELIDLLDIVASQYNKAEVLPIFVGDLINKGPKNVETIHKIRQLDHYSVRGNHDEAVLKQALLIRQSKDYQLPSRYAWVRNLSEEDILYLTDLPYTISIPSFNAIVVHAGLVPNVPLEEQDLTNMTVMRNLIKQESGFVPAEISNNGQPWASFWTGVEHVYFGHDAIRLLQEFPFATGLDGGCVYGNHLIGLLLSKDGTKELIKIKAKETYNNPEIKVKQTLS